MGEAQHFLEQVLAVLFRVGALPWWAILVAAILIVLLGYLRFSAAPPENRDDVDRRDVPDADSSWQTDPEHPGGDNVGGA